MSTRSSAGVAGMALTLCLGVGSVEAATDPGVACATAKLKAATKELGDEVKCHVKALKKGIPVAAECLTKAETKLEAAFAKAEAKGGCIETSMSSATYIEVLVDQALADLLAALPATGTPSPTPTATPGGVPGSCDVLTQDCPSGYACYAYPGECDGMCVPPGTGTQGQACTTHTACASGFGCVTVNGIGRCGRYCDSQQDCPSGTACNPTGACPALPLEICF